MAALKRVVCRVIGHLFMGWQLESAGESADGCRTYRFYGYKPCGRCGGDVTK